MSPGVRRSYCDTSRRRFASAGISSPSARRRPIRHATRKQDEDTTGESKFHSTDFNFYGGESVRIMCIDFGNKFEQNGYIDNLRVFISSSVYRNWINEEAYK